MNTDLLAAATELHSFFKCGSCVHTLICLRSTKFEVNFTFHCQVIKNILGLFEPKFVTVFDSKSIPRKVREATVKRWHITFLALFAPYSTSGISPEENQPGGTGERCSCFGGIRSEAGEACLPSSSPQRAPHSWGACSDSSAADPWSFLKPSSTSTSGFKSGGNFYQISVDPRAWLATKWTSPTRKRVSLTIWFQCARVLVWQQAFCQQKAS